jgi:hypothetical protein
VEKRGLEVNAKTGAEIQTIVEDVLKMKPAVVERARKVILGG